MERTWEKIKLSHNKKNDYITKGQFDKLAQEMQSLTLHPQINKTSKKMVEKVFTKSKTNIRIKFLENVERRTS